jgi:hypothetical protein
LGYAICADGSYEDGVQKIVSVLAAMSDEELAERLARLDRIERALTADKEQATGETLN